MLYNRSIGRDKNLRGRDKNLRNYSMKLFIVESPGKCVKIKAALGPDYKVAASVGHIRAIPKKGMNIDIKNGFTPTFEISADKKQVVKDLKSLADEADEIYLATDKDREGEAISWHIYDVLSEKAKKKCKRVTYTEITSAAIKECISHKRDIDMNQVNAQKARQVLDRLIGYKISPLLWFKVGSGTSAGRVQSIALKFISTKEKEIQAFKPQDYWFIEAFLECSKGKFWGKVVTKDKDNKYSDEKIVDSELEKLKKATYKIDSIERAEKIVKPYPPFDTASLQTSCSSLFGWSSKKTATLSQALYEQGKITYIRTDSFNIAQEAVEEVRKLIKIAHTDKYLPASPQVYLQKSKSSAQEAHECIRPTHSDDNGSDISDSDEKKLYCLIRDRFFACQMTPMVVDTVVYNTKASSGHMLVSRGQAIKFDGWSKAYKYSTTKEEILPDTKEGENLKLEEIKKTKHTTQPPARYNDGSLIKKMVAEGVGRPSTYPAIVEAIQKKGYAEKIKSGKGALQPTDLGMRIFEFLDPKFSKDFFMDVAFTAAMEDDLDEIAKGTKTFLEVVQKIYDKMVEEIKKAEIEGGDKPKNYKETDQSCPVCGKGLVVERGGKFGKFYSCDQYPKCKNIFVLGEDGKFKTKEQKPKSNAEKTGEKCLVCKKGNIVKRNGQYGEFFACDAYPSCKAIFVKGADGEFAKKAYSGKSWKSKDKSEKSEKPDDDLE